MIRKVTERLEELSLRLVIVRLACQVKLYLPRRHAAFSPFPNCDLREESIRSAQVKCFTTRCDFAIRRLLLLKDRRVNSGSGFLENSGIELFPSKVTKTSNRVVYELWLSRVPDTAMCDKTSFFFVLDSPTEILPEKSFFTKNV